MAGSIIGDLSCRRLHVDQHRIKECLSVATSLDLSIDVEVENSQRFHFVHLATTAPHEKLFVADLDEADSLIRLGLHEQDVPVGLQLAVSCDRRGQFLRLVTANLVKEHHYQKRRFYRAAHTHKRQKR